VKEKEDSSLLSGMLYSLPIRMKLSSTLASDWITWWLLHDIVQELANDST